MTTRESLVAYAGREQAYVKHELLTAYLERFMMILGQHCPRVMYVDAFAGPWGSNAADYSDTSFGRAVAIIRGCKQSLMKLNRKVEFKALFIEANAQRFKELEAFAAKESEPGFTIEAWHGNFQDKIGAVSRWIGQDFAFVLIDPLGYKDVINPQVLAPLLAKRNVEALINYMWQFLSLAVGHINEESHLQNMIGVFGEAVRDVPRRNREAWLLELFKQHIVATSAPLGPSRTRAVSFPVEYPGCTTTKYFLIHITHNDMGVLKFSEASARAMSTQNSVRFLLSQQRRESRSGMSDIFGDDSSDLATGERTLADPWLEFLPGVGSEAVVDEPTLAMMIETHNCLHTELQLGLKSLIASGIVVNLDAKRPRPKYAVHVGERLRRLA